MPSSLRVLRDATFIPSVLSWHRLSQQYATVQVAHVINGSSAVLCGQAGSLHAANRQELLRRVHNLERHMRENKLRFTFTDALGRAQNDANDQATSVLCGMLHSGSVKL